MYSVLMSVYKSEKPEHLRLAMDSMWHQTIPTNDFVLICDGPLTAELDAVIYAMEQQHPNTLRVIRLAENHGLGYALKFGVTECRHAIVARMDSDDISRPERCEKQLTIFALYPEIAIVGSVIEEFTQIDPGAFTPKSINSKRIVPEYHKDIIEFAKKRNPFNHPSVMFRKQAVLDVGNYPDKRYMQDYYLWVYMLIAGYKGYNIQQPLVFMRADSNLFKRRSGKLYRELQINLFNYMKEEGFISNFQFLQSCFLRIASSMAPNWLRQLIFKTVLRNR